MSGANCKIFEFEYRNKTIYSVLQNYMSEVKEQVEEN